MKLNQKIKIKLNRVSACLMAISLCMYVGCSTSKDGDSEQTKQAKSSHATPTFSFHKPENFESAISRLQALHKDVLDPSQATIAARKIEYVEVIHMTGNTGHSHYYSASEYDANLTSDHGHGHSEDVKETVKRDTTDVDLQTELADLIGWLPELAASTELDEQDWKSVKTKTNQLEEMTSFLKEELSQEELRAKWKSESDSLRQILETLKQLAEKNKS